MCVAQMTSVCTIYISCNWSIIKFSIWYYSIIGRSCPVNIWRRITYTVAVTGVSIIYIIYFAAWKISKRWFHWKRHKKMFLEYWKFEVSSFKTWYNLSIKYLVTEHYFEHLICYRFWVFLCVFVESSWLVLILWNKNQWLLKI